jgi:hypothetical protein
LDGSRFDAWSRALAAAPSRRRLTQFLAGLALTGPLALQERVETAAKHKKRKRKHPTGPPASPPCGDGKRRCQGVCIPSNQCCADADCADLAPRCCRGTCLRPTECCADADCRGVQTCQGSTCGCPAPTTDCEGSCVRCPTGGACAGTRCVCPDGQTACSGTCYDTSLLCGPPGVCEACQDPDHLQCAVDHVQGNTIYFCLPQGGSGASKPPTPFP